MQKTTLLDLPVYDLPSEDKFHLADHNTGMQNLENFAQGLLANPQQVNIINQEVVNARSSEPDLNSRLTTTERKTFSPQDKFLQQFARKMHDKLAVTIECWGDSTYYGALSRLATATKTAPSIMQDLLQAYFDNGNIIVINKGTSGQATWNITGTWEANIIASTADIIYINYGINNMWADVNKLKQDLTFMINICRKHNKEVVLDCPNIVMQLSPQGEVDEGGFPYGGNPKHCYATMEHAQVTRDLARDLGVCFIDNYELTQQYNYFNTNLPLNSADGMHPSQELYYKKAANMCIPFIAPNCARVRVGDIISPVDSSVVATNYVVENSSITKSLAVSNKLYIGLFVEDNGVDVGLAFVSKNTSPTSIYINVDGEYMGSFNPKTLNTNSLFIVDNEFISVKGLTRGLHIIQLSTDTGGYVEFSYAKIYKSTNQVTGILKYSKNTISSNLQSNVVTDIVTDNYLKDLDISFKCKMHDKKGVSIFTNKMSGGIIYGVTLYINDASIAFAEYNQDGYIGNTIISADTNYKDIEHTYRFKMAKTSKILDIYCDDVLLKNTTLTQNYLGGFVGIFSLANTDFNVEITKLI